MTINHILLPDGKLISLSSDELYHHGVKGMRWGIRRSKERLQAKSVKLGEKNEKLAARVKRSTNAAMDYEARSVKLQSKNAKYEKQLAKATAKKAKYDAKANKALRRSVFSDPDYEKAAKYTSKAMKADQKLQKAKSKLRYNKWDQKASEAKQDAIAAKRKIERNEKLKNSFEKTIVALDAGTIEQGRLFMRYIDD